jgi:hypothetical protein
MPEKEAEITSIGDIVNKQMVHLMKGKLDEKQQQIVQKWKKKNASVTNSVFVDFGLSGLVKHSATPNVRFIDLSCTRCSMQCGRV